MVVKNLRERWYYGVGAAFVAVGVVYLFFDPKVAKSLILTGVLVPLLLSLIDAEYERNMKKIKEDSAKRQAEINEEHEKRNQEINRVTNHRMKVLARAGLDPAFSRKLNQAIAERGVEVLDEVDIYEGEHRRQPYTNDKCVCGKAWPHAAVN